MVRSWGPWGLWENSYSQRDGWVPYQAEDSTQLTGPLLRAEEANVELGRTRGREGPIGGGRGGPPGQGRMGDTEGGDLRGTGDWEKRGDRTGKGGTRRRKRGTRREREGCR